jgi:hypothetical protein
MADYASKSQQARLGMHPPRAERSANSMASDYSGWVGWILFAAVIMMLIGTFHVIQGLVALFKDDYFVVSSSGLVLDVGYTTWGVIHIVAGVVLVLAGIALFSGRMWARILGTVMACLSAIVNVGFLSAYPVWSTLMIALDVLIIMALTVHGSAMVEDA